MRCQSCQGGRHPVTLSILSPIGREFPYLMWALSRDSKGENGCVLPGIAASLAS